MGEDKTGQKESRVEAIGYLFSLLFQQKCGRLVNHLVGWMRKL